MANVSQFQSIDEVLGAFRMLAEKHQLTPAELEAMFNAGLVAVRMLRPEWLRGDVESASA